jgi:hypothetical protein
MTVVEASMGEQSLLVWGRATRPSAGRSEASVERTLLSAAFDWLLFLN